MKLPRRHFLGLVAGAAALPIALCAAWALDYPTRPVRVMVGFPPGIGPDITGRLMSQWFSDHLGQQFIVDNRPGASSNIGTEIAAKAAPDGYTLLVTVSTNAINATFYKNLAFDFVKNLVPVGFIGATPLVLVVPPSFPAKTVPEFIAYAKANPGKINLASQGVGSSPHVAGEMLEMMSESDASSFTCPIATNLVPDLLSGTCSSISARCRRSSNLSAMAGCGRSPSRRPSAPMRCRMCRRSPNSCRVTMRAAGTVSAPRPARRPISSTSSTRK